MIRADVLKVAELAIAIEQHVRRTADKSLWAGIAAAWNEPGDAASSTARASSALTFRSHVFRGARFPEPLIRSCKTTHDVVIAERAGLPVRVTSLERTLVDVLDRPRHSGGWEEIWRSLESVEFFDVERVVEYALLLDNATTAAKVGFYLEQHRDALMIEPADIEVLRQHRPRQPHYLDGARDGRGRLVAGWNLVVPREVLDRAWEEVS